VLKEALTRRQLIGGMAVIGFSRRALSITPEPAATGACSSIHQEIEFKASPQLVYEALIDEKQFGAFTHGVARIEREPGGEFKLFAGRPGIKGATGRNVELVPNQRIVQAWRAVEWPAGVYSLVRFDLAETGSGTRLVFDQIGLGPIPPKSAWSLMYWEPLRKYLDSAGSLNPGVRDGSE
jgi:uncharacterized protein YndB with AHSA1/START domain